MNLYDIFPSDDKASLVNEDSFKTLSDFAPFQFAGKRQENWKVAKFEWDSENDKYRSSNDFILVHNGVGVSVALTEKAKNALESVLKEDAEYLAINIKGETQPFYLLNIIHVVEHALNLDLSEFRIQKNGGLGSIRKTVFNSRKIPSNRAFVYPQSIKHAMFCGELLKETCQKYELTGLDFTPYDRSQIS